MKNYDIKSTEEWARLTVASDKTPQLSVYYSLAFSLYQYLVYLSKMSPKAAEYPEGEAWPRAAQRVSRLYYPLGPLNFFEFPLIDIKTVPDLGLALQTRAAFFADEISGAVAEVAEQYRESLWPAHRDLLSRTLEELADLIAPRKDSLLSLLSERLNLREHQNSYQLALVPLTYQETGAYSHPTVISAEKFKGAALAEAVIHELSHVMIDLNEDDQESAYGLMRGYCSARNRPERETHQLFHLLLFHITGKIIQEVLSPTYVPMAESKKLYERTASIFRLNLSAETLDYAWSGWVDGRWGLETAIQKFVDSLTSERDPRL